MLSTTLIGTVLAALGGAFAALFAWIKVKDYKHAKELAKVAEEGRAAMAGAIAQGAVTVDEARNAVKARDDAREKINEQVAADRSAVAGAGTADDGLRSGAETVNAAIDRANRGV